MKKFFIIIGSLVAGISIKAQTTDLVISVSNIKSPKGIIEIGLFDNKADFLKPGKASKTQRFEVTSVKQVFVLKDIKPGQYAVSLYHDINGDGKCNLNGLGIPQEGFGFSNNVKPLLSAPQFDACRFCCAPLPSNVLAIRLINM